VLALYLSECGYPFRPGLVLHFNLERSYRGFCNFSFLKEHSLLSLTLPKARVVKEPVRRMLATVAVSTRAGANLPNPKPVPGFTRLQQDRSRAGPGTFSKQARC
jgi:hypothetical protein